MQSKTESEQAHPISQRFRGFLPVVVDVETGGLIPKTDALLDIASVLLRLDGDGWLRRGETHRAPGVGGS